MAGIQIIGTGSAVPEKTVTNDEMSTWLDTSDEWIYQRTGIHRRHIASEGESCHDFAIRAARAALQKAQEADSGFSKDKIIAVLTATMTSDYICPSVSCILQSELGLPENIAAYDICAACTGYVYALHNAYRMLLENPDGYVLTVGSECMSRMVDYRERSVCVLFGDGAGAAVLKFDPGRNSFFLPIAGTRGNRKDLYCAKPPLSNGYLHMNGQEVYRFASVSLRSAIERLLEKSGLAIEQIDQVVCHQANARIIDSVRRRFPGSEDKFYQHMEEYANTSAASVALVMDEMFQKGILHEHMTIICAAFGAGLSWNAVLMTL